MHLSLPKRFPLFILASVCWSLLCLISALPQEVPGGHFFSGSLGQLCFGEAGTLGATVTGECSHGGCPRSRHACFPRLHCSDSGLLCRELSDAGPGLHALLRSGPLRFKVSGTLQRRRLGWACVLRPAQAGAAQVTRCLAGEFTHS